MAAEFSQRWLAPDMVADRKKFRNYADTEKLRDAVIKADRFGLDDYYVFMAELNFFLRRWGAPTAPRNHTWVG